jgi:hypothetical protein
LTLLNSLNKVDVDFMTFARMHNKCFLNAPDGFTDKDVVKYDSDNFNGNLFHASWLNMHCDAFYIIDGILVVITSITSTTIFAITVTYFWKLYSITLTLVFKEIISNSKEEKTKRNKVIAERITSERLLRESEDSKFKTTERHAKAVFEYE